MSFQTKREPFASHFDLYELLSFIIIRSLVLQVSSIRRWRFRQVRPNIYIQIWKGKSLKMLLMLTLSKLEHNRKRHNCSSELSDLLSLTAFFTVDATERDHFWPDHN